MCEDRGVKVTVDARQVQLHMTNILPPLTLSKKHPPCARHGGRGGAKPETIR